VYRNFIFVIFTALFFLMNSHASAGSFKAVPVRLFVDVKSKTAVLRIVNQGDERVTVQLDAKSWRQDETGQDTYRETADIIFFPKIATLEKGEERIIRIGYRGKQEQVEKTYRLFMQELPVTESGGMALQLALTITIPIFVEPEKEEKAAWIAETAGFSEEALRIKVRNNSNRHIVVSRITVVGLDESGREIFSRDAAGWYTLAQTSRIYAVPIPHEECLKVKTMRVKTDVEKDSRTVTLNVEKEMCSRKPESDKNRMKEKASH
jgi:fimbrial chaperone protein